MNDYQTHPDSFSNIELRAGESIHSYIAAARRFASVEEWREYRDGSPQRRKEMRRDRNQDNSADSGDDIRRRTLEFLKASK